MNQFLVRHVQTIQRIIEDHKPLVDDLLGTAQELIDIFSPDDGQTVRDEVGQLTARYGDVKLGVREKLHLLNGTLRPTATDVGQISHFLVLCYVAIKLLIGCISQYVAE